MDRRPAIHPGQLHPESDWLVRFLSGVISDRLRKNFTTDQILNNPRKSDTKPMPKKGVQGTKLGGKAGRKVK